MKRQKVSILVFANDIMEAETMRLGIQNVLDELGVEHQGFVAELAQPGVARSYKMRLESITKNPLFKMLASKF